DYYCHSTDTSSSHSLF
nr:immunoglobulin light chain junction region [Macaca mulatta]